MFMMPTTFGRNMNTTRAIVFDGVNESVSYPDSGGVTSFGDGSNDSAFCIVFGS